MSWLFVFVGPKSQQPDFYFVAEVVLLLIPVTFLIQKLWVDFQRLEPDEMLSLAFSI